MASTSSFTSSSSSIISIPRTSTYDVFLSFRGEDTRYSFTDHLYNALLRRGIRTFRDDQLRRGGAIAPELLKAIDESRSSVIVFSANYARSRWCLDELVKIMECHKGLRHDVFPIFYHVDPSHVRKQTGCFGDAFAGYEENWKDKVEKWRMALTESANLSGWHLLDGYEYESDQIKEITDSIFRRLNCKRLDAGANLVGMDSRVKEVILQLHMESSDVRIVGICGVGGIGKTTLAKVIYNKLSCEFDCMSFLENVREKFHTPQGLSFLQNELLGGILEGEGSQNISGVAHKASMIKAILSSKRVFVVLDDVDDENQLEDLLRGREWLGKGSRVIITTRNKHVLDVQRADGLYEVEGLNFEEACELFSLYAFKQNLPKSDFRSLSSRVVHYCRGHPLALKVLGSLLFNKTIPQWEGELNKLDKELKAKIHNVLKRSYDGLERADKNIFLDIACFFQGEDRDFVSRILDGCDFDVERGIRNLNDLCLITLPYNHIYMHDLIRQMGQEIVRENFPNEPNKWSRLWDPHDIECALTTYEGIQRLETISLDLFKLKRVCFNSNVFAKMTRLRLLQVSSAYSHNYPFERGEGKVQYVKEIASKVQLDRTFKFPSYELRYLCWDGYPLDFLPSNFDGAKLVELHLKCSNIKQLWQGNKYLERLRVIDLSLSRKLIQMPKFSSMPNLERLILEGCVSLIEIHPSIGNMKNLTTLNLKSCDKLKDLPDSIGDLKSLGILDLSNCSRFEKFPEKGGNMKSLKQLRLNCTAIKDLPDSIGDLESLKILDLSYTAIKDLPDSIGDLESLKILDLSHTAIKDLPDSIGDLESLEILDLSDCLWFEKFPEKGRNMKSLKQLRLKFTAIKDLPDSIGDLESLEILDLSNCLKFEKFPEKGGNMKSLKELPLNYTVIKDLPDSIGDLESLKILDLSDCSRLEKVPKMERSMKHLCILNLRWTATVGLPSIDKIGELWKLHVPGSKGLRGIPNNILRLEFPEKLIIGGCSDLLEGLVSNQLHNLGKLNIIQCKLAREILKPPSSIKEIHAHHCRSKDDLSSLLWCCHLNWLKSATEESNCWKLHAVTPECSGIPEWIRYQNLGSEVTTELPTNWFEDPDFLGFVVSCVYRPLSSYIPSDSFCGTEFTCKLNFHANGFGFKDECWLWSDCACRGYSNDQVWVWWYPKMAILKEHHHKFTHLNASFECGRFINTTATIKKCGINLIFAGNQHDHKPVLLDHLWNSGDNGSTLQDTNGNVRVADDFSKNEEL